MLLVIICFPDCFLICLDYSQGIADRLGPEVASAVVGRHGLRQDDVIRIQDILAREPNFAEPGIFSLMWQVHRSDKNARRELRKFPMHGANILEKAGEENAGGLDN